MKFLLIADLHLSDRSPASCTETYLDDLFTLLEQTVSLAREHEVPAVIWAGDAFHNKAPSKTSHRLVQRTIRLLRSYPCPVYIVPGNHDLAHDRLDSVGVTQPLGVLYSSGSAFCLDGWMGGTHPVFGVPWQQRWSEEGIAECLRPWREQRAVPSLIVTHAPIYPRGSEPRYDGAEYTPADWWVDAVVDETGGPDVFYGHIHEPHGVWRRAGMQFCNNGALSRGSLDEYNLTRDVGVTLWDSGTGEFEFIPLAARPSEEVFRLREHEQVVTAQGRLGSFLTEIGTVQLPRCTPASVMASIRERAPGREVIVLCEQILDSAEHAEKRR